MARKVTLQDVAREAKLSLGSTSKALNGRSGISDETRQLVLNISERLGYRRQSRELPQSGPIPGSRVALIRVDPYPDDPAINRWTTAFVQAARQHELRLELCDVEQDQSPQTAAECQRVAADVTGILIFGYIKANLLRAIKELSVPAIVVGNIALPSTAGLHLISTDTLGMGMHATRTLLRAGHQRIGMFCPYAQTGGWFDQWLAGYQIAMMRSEADYDPALCPVFPLPQTPRTGIYQVGREAAQYMLSLPEQPTAYVVPEAQMAWSFRHAMAAQGHDLAPQQLIVGADPDLAADQGLGAYPLLTENTPMAASLAMQLLIDLAQGKDRPPVRSIVPFQTQHFEIFQHTRPLQTRTLGS